MKFRHFVWGVFFIGVAVFIILNQLGFIMPFGVSIWRIALAALLLAASIQSIYYMEFFGIFVPLAVIGLLFAKPLGIEALTPWPLLAASVCISIGCYILFHGNARKRWQSRRRGRFCQNGQQAKWGNEVKNGHADFNETHETIADDVIHCEVTFGAGIKYLHSESLKSANFVCSFGSLKVYFDQSQLSPDGAVVNVECSFGGVELYIPRKWHVDDKLTPTLGRVKSGYNAPENKDATLTLVGNVQFGSVDVIYI